MYKSTSDRMVDGVCGGVAKYFGLDPTLVRIATVLLAIFGGIGVLLYIVSMIVMPREPATMAGTNEPAPKPGSNEKFWGVLLLVVGSVWLMGNLGIPIWHGWWGFSWGFLLPLILILAGVAFLFGGRNYISGTSPTEADAAPSAGKEPATPTTAGTGQRRLYRSHVDRKVFGVCSGLGIYFNIDPTIVRLLFVVSAFASFGITLLMYIIMAVVVPDESVAPRTV